MVFRLLVFLCFTVAASGAIPDWSMGVRSDPDGTLGDRCAEFLIRFDASNSESNVRASLGLTEGRPASEEDYVANGWFRTRNWENQTNNASDERYFHVCGLKPNSTYSLSLEVSDTDGTTYSGEQTCPTTCTNCNPGHGSLFQDVGPGHSNLSCVSGENPSFNTAILDSGAPVKPVSPTITLLGTADDPDGTHPTNGACSDLTTQYDAAETAAEGGSTIERVVTPAGVRCGNLEDIRAISSGRVQFGPDVDPKEVPPKGSKIDPTFRDKMTWLSPDPDDPGTWVGTTGGLTMNQLASGGVNTDFVLTRFSPPDHTEVDEQTLTITGIDVGTDTITVDTSTSPIVEDNIVIVNLADTGVTDCHGPVWAINVTGTTLQVSGSKGGGACDLKGSYTDGGTVKLWPSKAITGHADNGSGLHRITVPGHGLGNYPGVPITGNSSATVLTFSVDPNDYQLIGGGSYSVYVTGSSDASCNGLWVLESLTSNSATLSGDGLDCDDATDGTLHRLRPFALFDTSSTVLGELNTTRAHLWFVVDSNTIDLLNTPFQSGASGGYITWEAQIFPGWFRVGTTTSSLRFDRCIIECPPPWRCQGIMNATHAADFTFAHSWVYWDTPRIIDPVTGSIQSLETGTAANGFYYHGSDNFLWWNNTYAGLVFFFSDTSLGPTTHHRYAKSYFFIPDRFIFTHGASDGFRRDYAYEFEWKSMRWLDFDGNVVWGQWQDDFSQSGAVVAMTGVGPDQRDIWFRNNGFSHIVSGLHFSTNTNGNTTRSLTPVQRIWVTNNSFANMETAGRCYNGCTGGGQVLQFWVNMEDFVWRNNLVTTIGAGHGGAFSFGGLRGFSAGGQFEYNALLMNEGSSGGNFGVKSTSFGSDNTDGIPTIDSAVADSQIFDAVFREHLDPDPLSFFTRNLVIPGVHQHTTNYAGKIPSTLDADTITADELAAHANMDEVAAGNTFVGAAGTGDGIDSLEDRIALAFEPGSLQVKRNPYAGFGPDIELQQDYQGWTHGFELSATTTTLTANWRTPPGHPGCSVDITPVSSGYFTSAAAITRQTDAGDDSETFSGLTAGVQYYGRLWCYEKVDFTVTPGTPQDPPDTYYVDSVSGSDGNPGSSAEPWGTFQFAVNQLGIGDTLIVEDGTYSCAPCTVSVSGTANAPITIKARNLWGATLDGGGSPDNDILAVADGNSWLVIEGLEITDSVPGGVSSGFNTSDIIYRHLQIHNIGRVCTDTAGGLVGFRDKDTSVRITYDSNWLYNIGRLHPGEGDPACDASSGNHTNHDHGIYLRGQFARIVNNVWDTFRSGWAIQAADGASNAIIANNTFYGANPNREGQVLLWNDNTNFLIANNISDQAATSFLRVTDDVVPGDPCSTKTNIRTRHNLVTAAALDNESCGFESIGNTLGVADMGLVDPANDDFTLESDSPAIDYGLMNFVSRDFAGVSRAHGDAPDAGAYERVP